MKLKAFGKEFHISILFSHKLPRGSKELKLEKPRFYLKKLFKTAGRFITVLSTDCSGKRLFIRKTCVKLLKFKDKNISIIRENCCFNFKKITSFRPIIYPKFAGIEKKMFFVDYPCYKHNLNNSKSQKLMFQ